MSSGQQGKSLPARSVAEEESLEMQGRNTLVTNSAAEETASCPTQSSEHIQAPTFIVEGPSRTDLTNGVTIQGIRTSTSKRRWRRHNKRFGVLIGSGCFCGRALLVTLTADNTELGSLSYARHVNSGLSAVHELFRDRGKDIQLTARELGSTTRRLHHHVVVDLDADDLKGFLKHLTDSSPRYASFAQSWVPNEQEARLMKKFQSWVERGAEGKEQGRSQQELLLSRYLRRVWKLGYVDVVELPAKCAVGYVLSFAGNRDPNAVQPHTRISYSRRASELWPNGAWPIVYAVNGECAWYPPRDPDWVKGQVEFLDRMDVRRARQRENANRSTQQIKVGRQGRGSPSPTWFPGGTA